MLVVKQASVTEEFSYEKLLKSLINVDADKIATNLALQGGEEVKWRESKDTVILELLCCLLGYFPLARSNTMKPLRVVPLFSGAGGLDLGFKLSGMYQIIFANDVNPSATTTYAKNFEMKLLSCDGLAEATPKTVLSCDVEKVLFSSLAGEADIVVGGPPCQDFSIVRGPTRSGITVKRGRLYAHFVRALTVLRPKAFVFENVPGLISANSGLAYKTIIEDFNRLNTRWEEIKEMMSREKISGNVKGYEIIFNDVVDFATTGVPQKRERLIIIGIRRDLIRSAEQIWQARAVIDRALRKTIFARFPLTPLEVFEGKRLDELQGEYTDICIDDENSVEGFWCWCFESYEEVPCDF